MRSSAGIGFVLVTQFGSSSSSSPWVPAVTHITHSQVTPEVSGSLYSLNKWSQTFSALGTTFVEDNFSTDVVGERQEAELGW